MKLVKRSFRYYNQGYETERFINLLYILHNKTPEVVEAAVDKQIVRKLGDTQMLNNRENLVPVMVVFMGSLMGFFIVIAYVFLDKDEGGNMCLCRNTFFSLEISS